LAAIREDISHYDRPLKPMLRDHHYRETIRDAERAFTVPPVSVYHLDDIRSMEQKTDDSSPGLPWIHYGLRTKRAVKDDNRAWQSIKRYWSQVKRGAITGRPVDSLAYVKTHIVKKGKPNKVRAVWGYPATMSFMEMCFCLPLLKAMKNCTPIAYGFETARGGTSRMRSFIRERGKWISCLDFKWFDKTVPDWVIYDAFDILRRNLSFSRYQGYGIPNALGLERCFWHIQDYFVNTTIRMCTGERFAKRVGVPSGSGFTQIIDSIVNWIVCTYLFRKQGIHIKGIKVFGDDSIIITDEKPDMDKLVEDANELFGMTINAEKSLITEDVEKATFLGYNLTLPPTRPTGTMAASLVYPARPNESESHFRTRALGMCIANFGQDVTFDSICREICATVKYEIEVDKETSRFLTILGIDLSQPRPPDRLRLLHMCT
jgi:hypothetical protein